MHLHNLSSFFFVCVIRMKRINNFCPGKKKKKKNLLRAMGLGLRKSQSACEYSGKVFWD